MLAIGDSRLTKGVKVFLDLFLVLGLVGCGGLALWLLASPLVMAGGETTAEAAVPVVIGSHSVFPIISVSGAPLDSASIRSPKIVKARGELRFRTSSWGLQFVCNLGYLIGLLVVMSVVYLIRKVLQEVAKGEPFGQKNANRIRGIGLVVLLVGILGPIIEYAVARVVLARIPAADPALSAPLAFDSEPLLAGALILIIAQIWVYGSALEHEQALTI
jgi:hypothetical protein